MKIGLKPVTLVSIIGLNLLLSGCRATPHDQIISEPVNMTVEQDDVHIDWATIDTNNHVVKNHQPRNVTYSNFVKSLAQSFNRPIADVYRIETTYDSPEVAQVIQKIKAQLGDSYVDIYRDGYQNPRFVIITRKNVVADTYDYVVPTGEARGFSIEFEILPIAGRSKEDMLDIYSNAENLASINEIITKYGGEMQGLGFTPVGFKIVVDSYFAIPLSPERHAQIEAELEQLTGVTVEVNSTGRITDS